MTVETERRPAVRQMSLQNWGLVLLLGLVWGGSFFFARIAVAEMPPLMLVMYRVVIAAAFLQLWLLFNGTSFRLALPHAGGFLALATLNNVIPFSLIFLGQTELGAGLASVLNATTPFWTAILAHLFTTDERLTLPKIVGILFGIAGTAVMIGPGLLAGLGGPIWAKFALVGAAFSYGLAFIYARRFRTLPSPVVATGQLTASSVIMIPLVLALYGTGELFTFSDQVWAATVSLAVLSTTFAYLIYFHVLATAGATNASLVTFVVPVSAILLGAVFLQERLESFEFAGMALIAVGLITIDGRLFRPRR
ncbi:DMT family transporter [Nitratireductor sp. ZSWI3]|uniref:DMT family transporter n=1 Tax=Nitratireductor sp. ZSWI3 TaxID=2966359 RepID=UPI0021504390|nr:DMT family transporter [Nitratireductor sp. ZSWI3]MCR4266076.1 DMT family transporter [Nitratireductor sp. ZSWI3]